MPVKHDPTQPVHLRDYLDVVIRHRSVVSAAFFTALAIAIVAAFFMKQSYVASAVIQNASFADPVIKKAETIEIITSGDFLAPIIKKLGLDIPVQTLKNSIKLEDIKETDFLRLKVRRGDKAEALELCDSITRAYLSRVSVLYQRRLDSLNTRIRELDSQMLLVNTDIEKAKEAISVLPKISSKENASATRLVFFQNTLPSYRGFLLSLLEEKTKLQTTIDNNKNFEIIDSPAVEAVAVGAKRAQTLVLAAFLGLLSGFFLAFFIDYWERTP